MYYKNGRITNNLPNKLELNGKVIFNPKWHHFESAGWKEFPQELVDVGRKFIKWEDGNPVEMSQGEKDALLAQETEKAKNDLYNDIIRKYTEVELQNITPAGSVQMAEWCQMGIQMALANREWFQNHYAERLNKLLTVDAGDLSVDPEPTSLWKPYSFRDIMTWLHNNSMSNMQNQENE